MDDFNDYGIEMESELVNHDIDDVDKGINEEDNSDERFNDIDFDLNK